MKEVCQENLIYDQTKYDQTSQSVNYKKFRTQFVLLSLFCKFCLLVALDQYLLNTNYVYVCVCVCNSVIVIELHILISKSIKAPFFRFQRRCTQMDHQVLPKYNFFKKILTQKPSLINFKNSLKILFLKIPDTPQ